MDAGDTVLSGPRVALRGWRPADREAFAAMNADPAVMRHFVAPWTGEQSAAAADRIAAHLARRRYGWWVLQTAELSFAGCVGLVDVGFELPGLAGPQVEIGWRLRPQAWGRGLASEAAALCLAQARDVLALPRVVSFTTLGNVKSIAVMQRIGLAEVARFEHPRVPVGHPQRRHVLYATVWDG